MFIQVMERWTIQWGMGLLLDLLSSFWVTHGVSKLIGGIVFYFSSISIYVYHMIWYYMCMYNIYIYIYVYVCMYTVYIYIYGFICALKCSNSCTLSTCTYTSQCFHFRTSVSTRSWRFTRWCGGDWRIPGRCDSDFRQIFALMAI